MDVSLSADETKIYEGSITKVSAIGTYSTSGSTFDSTIEFENDGNAKIGMSASCTVILEEAVDCISVPVEAIQTKRDTKYVVKVNADGTTEDVTVETGISNDSYVQILSGLEGNETIQMLKTTSSTGIRSNSKSSGSLSNQGEFGGMSGQMGGGSMGQMMSQGGVPTR